MNGIGRGPGGCAVPEQHQVVGDVERVDDRERQHPRAQLPEAVGVNEKDDSEEWAEDEVVRDAVELVTEDDQAADGRIVGELKRLGEIGKREHDEQHRHHGEECSTARGSFVCHAREASRARELDSSLKTKRPERRCSGRCAIV